MSAARGLIGVLLTALLAVAGAGPAAGQLFQWTDEDGVERYTNDPTTIPPKQRAGVREIGTPKVRPPEPTAAVQPTVLPFAAGQPIRAAVRLNGIPLTLVLDTGADRTVISPAAVARAGFDPERGRDVQIIGATGTATARETIVEGLDVAGTRLGPLAVVVHDIGLAGVDGLLGRDVLDAFTLTVDTAAGHAILTPR